MTKERGGEGPLCLGHLDCIRARMRRRSGAERREEVCLKCHQAEGKVKALLAIAIKEF